MLVPSLHKLTVCRPTYCCRKSYLVYLTTGKTAWQPGSAPNPAGGAYSTPPDLRAGGQEAGCPSPKNPSHPYFRPCGPQQRAVLTPHYKILRTSLMPHMNRSMLTTTSFIQTWFSCIITSGVGCSLCVSMYYTLSSIWISLFLAGPFNLWLCLCIETGGCGSMFEVHIMSEEFRGVRTVMQHRMVNEVMSRLSSVKWNSNKSDFSHFFLHTTFQ